MLTKTLVKGARDEDIGVLLEAQFRVSDPFYASGNQVNPFCGEGAEANPIRKTRRGDTMACAGLLMDSREIRHDPPKKASNHHVPEYSPSKKPSNRNMLTPDLQNPEKNNGGSLRTTSKIERRY